MARAHRQRRSLYRQTDFVFLAGADRRQDWQWRERMDGALARCTWRRWLCLGDLFHRARFFQPSCRLHWRRGPGNLRSGHLGIPLGACRHAFCLFFCFVDLFWRADVVAQGWAAGNSSGLRFYGACHLDQGADRRRITGAHLCCVHDRQARLAHDRRCQIAPRHGDFFSRCRPGAIGA